jgi:hypothetical protein
VLAEDPPPPPPTQDPGGNGVVSNPGAAQDTELPAASETLPDLPEAAPPIDIDFTAQPNYSPGGAATSGLGIFQAGKLASEQLFDTNGNPVQEGTDLAALAAGWAYACAPGKIPDFILGGTCSVRFADAQEAIDTALPGWTVWFSQYFDDPNPLAVNKALTLQGDPREHAKLVSLGLGGIILSSSNITLRDLFVKGLVKSIDSGGTLRLQNVAIQSDNTWALLVQEFYGSVILSQVNASFSAVGSYIDVRGPSGISTGTVTVLNSAFNNTATCTNTPDCTDDTGYGLKILANNAVKLENVSASANWNTGLYVEYARSLSIKNGIFDYNYNGTFPVENPADGYGYGIQAFDTGATPGTVLLQNVSASNNDEDGIHIQSPGAVTVLASAFWRNALDGLHVTGGRSSVTLDGDTANGNGWHAAGYNGASIYTTGTVSVTASRFIKTPDGSGLLVNTHGAVNLKGLEASYNGWRGVEVYNNYSGSTSGVTVSNGYFAVNDASGLYVLSHGSVTLNGITAEGNNWDADDASVDIDNCLWTGTICQGVGNVTISSSLGSNIIRNNFNIGLMVYTRGNISISALSADNNTNQGMRLMNHNGVGNVTLVNIRATNNGNDPLNPGIWARGIEVLSRGSISLDKVDASLNSGEGIYLKNRDALSAKSVTLKNITTWANADIGVEISSTGAVTINHIVATDNVGHGLMVDNSTVYKAGITILNTLGANLLLYNTGDGLQAGTFGTLSITGLQARENYTGHGAWIIQAGNVTISNSLFNENDLDGLDVTAAGNITLNNVQVNSNEDYGALLVNNDVIGKSVTVNKSIFNGNWIAGLGIHSSGTVTLNAVSANQNLDNGVWIENDVISGAYNVNILSTLGANQFSNNVNNGVFIWTSGNVVISKASANSNSDAGYRIRFDGTVSKTITLTCSNATGNVTNLFVNNVRTTVPVTVYLNGAGLAGYLGTDWFSGGVGPVTFIASRVNCP